VASPRWVFESFRAQRLLDTKDFGLRLLEGLGICTAGLSVEEKASVAQMATAQGAQYDGRLELGFTSVLIAQVGRVGAGNEREERSDGSSDACLLPLAP
jgi:hypothetical protein